MGEVRDSVYGVVQKFVYNVGGMIEKVKRNNFFMYENACRLTDVPLGALLQWSSKCM